MNPEAIKQLQKSLGLTATGILDTGTINAMNKAVEKSVASNKNIAALTPADPSAISTAYLTGDWSGVTSPTGVPFSKKDQEAAFSQADRSLAPGFKAETVYDTANVEDVLRNQQDQLGDFVRDEAELFQDEKTALDQASADQGVLFAGSRFQKNNDLRKTFEDRQREAVETTGRNIANTARDFQYKYGNDNANKLSDFYKVNTGNTYNANVATGGAKPSMNLTSVYKPKTYDFQGTTINNRKAQTQVRAAGLLANKANKLLGQYQK